MSRLLFLPRPARQSCTLVHAFVAVAFAVALQNLVNAVAPETCELDRRFGGSVLIVDHTSALRDDPYAGLCGWGTHDSIPDARVAIQPKNEKAKPVSAAKATRRKSKKAQTNNVDKVIATIVNSLGSSVGVSVQQLAEPFAMVGPDGNSTLSEIAWLTKYWSHPESVPFANVIDADAITGDIPVGGEAQDDVDFTIVSIVPFVDFEGISDSLSFPASAVPGTATEGLSDSNDSDKNYLVDWDSHDDDGFGVVGSETVTPLQHDAPRLQVSNQSEQIAQEAEESLAIDSIALKTAAVSEGTQEADSRMAKRSNTTQTRSSDRLVGSAPVIATLDQVLLPFDLSSLGDGRRNLFPMESGAYCVVERNLLDDVQPEAKSTMAKDQIAESNVDIESVRAETTKIVKRAIEKIHSAKRRLIQKDFVTKFPRRRERASIEPVIAKQKVAKKPSVAAKEIGSHEPVVSPSDALLARADAVTNDPLTMTTQTEQVRMDQFTRTMTMVFEATESIQQWFRIAAGPDESSGHSPAVMNR